MNTLVIQSNQNAYHRHTMAHTHSIDHGHTAVTVLKLANGSNSGNSGLRYPYTDNYLGEYQNWSKTTISDHTGDSGAASNSNTSFNGNTNDREARPDNYTIKIWKRTT